MSGISQGNSSVGELDGQNFAVGSTSKDQRASKEALLKMTKNKRQGPAAPSKAAGGPANKSVSSELHQEKRVLVFVQCERKVIPWRIETNRCWSPEGSDQRRWTVFPRERTQWCFRWPRSAVQVKIWNKFEVPFWVYVPLAHRLVVLQPMKNSNRHAVPIWIKSTWKTRRWSPRKRNSLLSWPDASINPKQKSIKHALTPSAKRTNG